ncbi:MAG: hypothetical protein LBF76_02425, partial [Holosporales bacterium]|nr:hypothetical protein [Holosporales bacterium]
MPGGITGLSGLVGGGNPKRPGEPPLSPAFRKFFASGPEEKENVWPPKKATPVIPVGKKNTLALTSECLLSLLVAQLRNQDPFNPTEGTEFINQLSMLAGVQQSTEMNDKLEKMLRYFTTAETVSAAAIVGKTIESPGQWFEFGGSEAFELSFETPEKVTEAMVSVFDEEGNLIRSCPAVAHPVVEEGRIIGLEAEAPTAGRHKIIFNWLDEHTPYSPG